MKNHLISEGWYQDLLKFPIDHNIASAALLKILIVNDTGNLFLDTLQILCPNGDFRLYCIPIAEPESIEVRINWKSGFRNV